MKKLIVKAKHFKDTEFCPCFGLCALEKAAAEQFKDGDMEWKEGVYDIRIHGIKYYHELYGCAMFSNDLERAKVNGFDETVIREVELDEVVPA